MTRQDVILCLVSIESLLQKFSAFRGLTTDELVQLAGIFKYQKFEAGQCLLRQGEVSPQLILIDSGRVQIFQTKGGAGQQLSELGPGEAIGEFTLLSSDPHGANATATTEVEAYVATGADFHGLIEKNTAGVAKMLRNLMMLALDRYRQMEERMDFSTGRGLAETSLESRLMQMISRSESVRINFCAGQQKEVEGFFKLADFSPTLGMLMVRYSADLDAKIYGGEKVKVREYMVPLSGLRYIQCGSTEKLVQQPEENADQSQKTPKAPKRPKEQPDSGETLRPPDWMTKKPQS